mgnify:CR=1 FL=1
MKGEKQMKKYFAYILAAVAMLATSSASVGCLWTVFDEPKAIDSLCD